MFGSDDQNQNPGAQATPANDTGTPTTDSTASVDTVAPSSVFPTGTPAQNISAESDALSSAPSAPSIPDPMVTPSVQPESGINGVPLQNAYVQPVPQIGMAKPSESDNVSVPASMTSGVSSSAVDPDLARIRQQALQSLEPLVGQLDQAPDEKFKTVMMLIQASDNSKMLGSAYEAASQITDEKTRAQALLDVVNEINYFTTQAQNNKQ